MDGAVVVGQGLVVSGGGAGVAVGQVTVVEAHHNYLVVLDLTALRQARGQHRVRVVGRGQAEADADAVVQARRSRYGDVLNRHVTNRAGRYVDGEHLVGATQVAVVVEVDEHRQLGVHISHVHDRNVQVYGVAGDEHLGVGVEAVLVVGAVVVVTVGQVGGDTVALGVDGVADLKGGVAHVIREDLGRRAVAVGNAVAVGVAAQRLVVVLVGAGAGVGEVTQVEAHDHDDVVFDFAVGGRPRGAHLLVGRQADAHADVLVQHGVIRNVDGDGSHRGAIGHGGGEHLSIVGQAAVVVEVDVDGHLSVLTGHVHKGQDDVAAGSGHEHEVVVTHGVLVVGAGVIVPVGVFAGCAVGFGVEFGAEFEDDHSEGVRSDLMDGAVVVGQGFVVADSGTGAAVGQVTVVETHDHDLVVLDLAVFGAASGDHDGVLFGTEAEADAEVGAEQGVDGDVDREVGRRFAVGYGIADHFAVVVKVAVAVPVEVGRQFGFLSGHVHDGDGQVEGFSGDEHLGVGVESVLVVQVGVVVAVGVGAGHSGGLSVDQGANFNEGVLGDGVDADAVGGPVVGVVGGVVHSAYTHSEVTVVEVDDLDEAVLDLAVVGEATDRHGVGVDEVGVGGDAEAGGEVGGQEGVGGYVEDHVEVRSHGSSRDDDGGHFAVVIKVAIAVEVDETEQFGVGVVHGHVRGVDGKRSRRAADDLVGWGYAVVIRILVGLVVVRGDDFGEDAVAEEDLGLSGHEGAGGALHGIIGLEGRHGHVEAGGQVAEVEREDAGVQGRDGITGPRGDAFGTTQVGRVGAGVGVDAIVHADVGLGELEARRVVYGGGAEVELDAVLGVGVEHGKEVEAGAVGCGDVQGVALDVARAGVEDDGDALQAGFARGLEPVQVSILEDGVADGGEHGEGEVDGHIAVDVVAGHGGAGHFVIVLVAAGAGFVGGFAAGHEHNDGADDRVAGHHLDAAVHIIARSLIGGGDGIGGADGEGRRGYGDGYGVLALVQAAEEVGAVSRRRRGQDQAVEDVGAGDRFGQQVQRHARQAHVRSHIEHGVVVLVGEHEGADAEAVDGNDEFHGLVPTEGVTGVGQGAGAVGTVDDGLEGLAGDEEGRHVRVVDAVHVVHRVAAVVDRVDLVLIAGQAGEEARHITLENDPGRIDQDVHLDLAAGAAGHEGAGGGLGQDHTRGLVGVRRRHTECTGGLPPVRGDATEHLGNFQGVGHGHGRLIGSDHDLDFTPRPTVGEGAEDQGRATKGLGGLTHDADVKGAGRTVAGYCSNLYVVGVFGGLRTRLVRTGSSRRDVNLRQQPGAAE